LTVRTDGKKEIIRDKKSAGLPAQNKTRIK
jgi:hypothetical protein